MTDQPHIVVLGAGFAGLTFCKAFPRGRARVTLVDRRNHHLFQPLLYQVATAGLSAAEIAQPIRSILNGYDDVHVRLDEVVGLMPSERRVVLQGGELNYDYLVVALGGVTSYFGHPEWEAHAPGLKSIEDAQRIRRNLLMAFERAENETDPAVRRRLMTVVIIGGGPTGIEMAGACAELTRFVLRNDFRNIDPGQARVILIEGSGALLASYPPQLRDEARTQLESMGVEVRTGARVAGITESQVQLAGGEVLEAANIVWAAGIAANPLGGSLGVELDRSGRVKVAPDLSIPGHPEVFAIGDLAAVIDKDGEVVPGTAPAAMQQARHVASVLEDELDGQTERRPFDFWDKGSMATIGRSAAVARIGRLELTGTMAWLAWLLVHLLFLIGFRNKVVVLLDWAYSYLTYRRGARIITGGDVGGAGTVRPPG